MPLSEFTPEKRNEFLTLFKEFVEAYLLTSVGSDHSAYYPKGREQARKNLEEIRLAVSRGDKITDLVLQRLMPYSNTQSNRDQGFWISNAAAFSTDLRNKFEGAGWRTDGWPEVANLILKFVLDCDEHPYQLSEACSEFSASPYSKGFQVGTLTPILNALRPENFVIFNKKSRLVLNYFTNSFYTQSLIEYPDANQTTLELIADLAKDMRNLSKSNILIMDLFDMFSHWVVAVKKYSLTQIFKTESKVSDGEILVSVPGPEDVEEIEVGTLDSENGSIPTGTNHIQVQYLLLTLGAEMGFDVWVARNDKSRVWQGKTLGSLQRMVEQLPLQFSDATQKTIELIDVLWLKGNSIVAAFEIEWSTSIYSGLLRMSDLLALQPNLDIKIYLVASNERRDKVKREIIRPTFRLREKPLNKVCGYLPLEDLVEKVDIIRKHRLASSLTPVFLTNIAEYFGDTNFENFETDIFVN